ncbi:LrgB family protein [Alkalihalobacillus sp. LMS39]|uniref:LrgB family protein n=1 Tax=Alkalihalobacillus sp. LMS39 TaxID=2924032 RepID=UPI001FB21C8E|nr:LrgB family protein [Alkalihalobacillus sp. LMS39]UOE93506.1 LrgB family protein [Alkalihalobacillus sp. LMS39]
MGNVFVSFLFIMMTLAVYILGKVLYKKYPNPLTLPILTGTLFIVFILVFFEIPYETYQQGGKWIEHLLGPAVVALGYPLYKQRALFTQYIVPVCVGVGVGSVVGVYTGFQLASWLDIEKDVIFSLLPKSVTTPVAMDIAQTIGGASPLAAIFVMFAGISGAVGGPMLLRWCKINHVVGRGVGMGTASHAIGTAKAMEHSEQEGAISTIAMTVSAVIVSVIIPVFVFFLY